MYAFAAADAWLISGGTSGNVFATATDGAWHASIATVNGASSVIAVDGVEVAGTATGSTATSWYVTLTGAGLPTTCSVAEAVYWDGYALTAGERTALQTNQKNFWGTP